MFSDFYKRDYSVFMLNGVEKFRGSGQQIYASVFHNLSHQQNLEAGEAELVWCHYRTAGEFGPSVVNARSWLQSLSLSKLARFEIDAPSHLELEPRGAAAEIPISLGARFDSGEAWTLGFEASLRAELEGEAAFVYADGGDAGKVVVKEVSVQDGESEGLTSLRLRLTGTMDATLKLEVTTAGASPSTAATSLLAAAENKMALCSALDLDAAACLRLTGFFTSGGAGVVAGGSAGVDAALGWSVVRSSSATGASALKTPAVANDRHSCVGFDVRLSSAEILSFDWRVSSQAGDTLGLWVDGSSVASIAGVDDQWQRHSQQLAAGAHQLRWCYEKDASGQAGADAAWLDNMHLAPMRRLDLSYVFGDARRRTSEAFEQVKALVELRVFDELGNALPLASLGEDSFPLRIKAIAPHGARVFGLPRDISFLDVGGDVTSYRVDLELILSLRDAAFRIVAETAASSSALVSNALTLESSSREAIRDFCEATRLDEADCALVTSIETDDDLPWYIGEIGERDFLRSNAHVARSGRSCLRVGLNLAEARTLVLGMSLHAHGRTSLIFHLNAFQRAQGYGDADIVDFSHREALEAGEAELSWCFEIGGDALIENVNAGWIRAMRLLKFDRFAIDAPAVVTATLSEPDKILDIPISAQALDTAGDIWLLDATATVSFALQGEAEFVGDDGRSPARPWSRAKCCSRMASWRRFHCARV